MTISNILKFQVIKILFFKFKEFTLKLVILLAEVVASIEELSILEELRDNPTLSGTLRGRLVSVRFLV